MKRGILLLLVGAAFFFGARALTGCFVDRPTVDRGMDPAGGGIEEIVLRGRFDPLEHVVDGQPTLIEFSADYCPGCRALHRSYDRFLAVRPDVAVRQVNLPDDWNPEEISRRHGVLIRAIPHVIVFGPDGDLLAMDTPQGFHGYEFLLGWIAEETR
jgi:thiol-disulfide isomerase/thioredoxin